jgi:hypothetical protein
MLKEEIKKLLILIISLLIIFLAIFLNNSSFVKNLFSSKVTDINGNLKTEFAINETAVYKDINYRITNAEYGDVIQGYKPMDENNTYYSLTFEVQNNSKNTYVPNYECILRTEEVTSEQINTTWTGDDSSDHLAVGEDNATTYFWEISKDDKAKTYWCFIYESDVEFTFDLTSR